MGLKRGDIVIMAPPGEFGKPRPAVIVQSNMALHLGTITYLMVTSKLEGEPGLRVPISPTVENGLLKPSEIMVDMIQTSSRSRFREVIGRIDAATLKTVEEAMLLFLGLI